MKSLIGNTDVSHGQRCRVIPLLRLMFIALFVASIFLAGCHTDPNLRKQRYLESGNRYSAQGKYREAAIQYANALKIDKGYADAHYELAKSYLHLGQVSSAYSELMRTVELQPTNYSARLDLAGLLWSARKPDDAKLQADVVVAAQPNNPDAHAMMSGITLQKGQRDVALAEIHRALELDPKRAEFHEQLALLKSGDAANSSQVEFELKNAVSLEPKLARPRLRLAALYVNENRWQEAERTALDAVAVEPRSLGARESLALIYFRQNDQAKAEGVLKEAASEFSDDPQGVRVLADYYERAGQGDKAKEEFESIASKHPKDLPLQEAYVRSLVQTRDYDEAQKVIADLIKRHGKDPQLLALKGVVLLNGGKVEEAILALQGAIKDYPKDPFIHFWLGKAALAKADLNLAEKSFLQVAELAPPGLQARQELALIASQKGDVGLLSDVAEKAIVLAPAFADGYVWRASVEMIRNSIDKAEADLQTAMKLAPSSASPWVQLGEIRFSQKRFLEGTELLEQALEKDPDSAQALRLLVSYELYQKHPEAALSRLNHQIEKRPANGAFYDLLADYQMQAKALDRALSAAQKAFEINSNDGQAVMLIARIQVQRGQTASAIAAWERWSGAHSADAGALAILGTLEEANGNQAKAEGYYRKSLQLQPEQPVAANNLAYLMLRNGENLDMALTLAQTARRAMPNSANAADTLAWAYYHKHTYAFARDLLEEAVKNDATNQMIQYHLGLVYRELKDNANAQNHLKKAISLAPSSATANDAKTALQGLG